MKKYFEKIDKENLVKIGVGIVAVIIVIALAIFLTSGTSENGGTDLEARENDLVAKEDIPFFEAYENMDLAEIDSYRFDIRIQEEDYNTTVMATNVRNQQLIVHSLSTLIPQEDGEDVTGTIVYDMGNEELLLDGSRFDIPFPFTSSIIFLESIENLVSLELNEGADEEGTLRQTYDVVFTKEYFNKMIEYTNVEGVEATEDVEGQIIVDGDFIFRIIFDHPDANIDVVFYAIGSGELIEIN